MGPRVCGVTIFKILIFLLLTFLVLILLFGAFSTRTVSKADHATSSDLSYNLPNVSKSSRKSRDAVSPQKVFEALQEKPSLGRHLECNIETDEILVFVHSHPEDYWRRNRIRNTWANVRLAHLTHARVFFVLGQVPDETVEDQQTLKWEQDIHNDLIQGGFDEDFDELEDLKSLIWLKWSNVQCPMVPYILKTTTDKFIDLITIREELDNIIDIDSHHLHCTLEIGRERNESTGNETEISTFCSGGTYLMSNGTRTMFLESLTSVLKKAKPQPNFISGFLAAQSKEEVLLKESPGLIMGKNEYLELTDEHPIVDLVDSEDSDPYTGLWEDLQFRHDLQNIAPKFDPNFRTTSYENHIIENPDYCSVKWPNMQILVVIHTNPAQADFRDAIRQTWGHPSLFPLVRLRPLFFMGRSPDPTLELEIRAEHAVHGDIVQTDYLDTYKNLTFKAISWMQWIEAHCSDATFLVKSDDDIMIDPFKLQNYLMKLSKTVDLQKHNKFHCYFWRYGRIERDENHKHYVSKELFKERRYPAYCSGSAFILTTKISQVLLDEFRRDPSYLWVDDVFITGILAKRAGIKHRSIAPAYALTKGHLDKEKRKRRTIFAHLSGRGNHEFRRNLWREFLYRNGYEMDAVSGSLSPVTVTEKPGTAKKKKRKKKEKV